MIIVLGTLTCDDANIDELLEQSLAHVRRSRAEPGCVSHDVARDVENPLRLLFTERWESQQALQTHFEVPASREFATLARSVSGGQVTIDVYPIPG